LPGDIDRAGRQGEDERRERAHDDDVTQELHRSYPNFESSRADFDTHRGELTSDVVRISV
jgi:hypothetical protein